MSYSILKIKWKLFFIRKKGRYINALEEAKMANADHLEKKNQNKYK